MKYVVLFLAGFAAKDPERMKKFLQGFVPAFAVLGLCCAMIIVEPDIGTSVFVALVVVSNQAIVARGLCTEGEVAAVNEQLQAILLRAGAPKIDGWYFCPHHPKATLPKYRQVCECRKPAAGMLEQAAREHAIELAGSFMVGDRISDIVAGAAAGCRTVLVQTGKHTAPPIETVEPVDSTVAADYSCSSLAEASRWILQGRD